MAMEMETTETAMEIVITATVMVMVMVMVMEMPNAMKYLLVLSRHDFVRWCRQILDLLDQVRIASPDAGLRAAAKRAIDDVRRGVVAVDSG